VYIIKSNTKKIDRVILNVIREISKNIKV
jgi:hypothetical protein